MVGIFDIEMVITGLRLIYCKGTAFEIYCRGTYKESRMLLYSSTGWIPSSSALLCSFSSSSIARYALLSLISFSSQLFASSWRWWYGGASSMEMQGKVAQAAAGQAVVSWWRSQARTSTMQ
jgi:hypothetical protein